MYAIQPNVLIQEKLAASQKRDLLVKLRRAAGMPCAEYLKPLPPKLAADYAAPRRV